MEWSERIRWEVEPNFGEISIGRRPGVLMLITISEEDVMQSIIYAALLIQFYF